ncbi:MAG: rod shape-determining protein MreC [Ilumatobacteraceae bacterium]
MPLYTPGRRRAIVLLLLTSVLLLTLDLRGNSIFDAARGGFSRLMDPFETAADVVTKPARNAWRGITDYEQVEEENQQLRDQLDAQRGDQVAAQAAIQDYQELLALNDLASLGDYPTVVAMVVGESPSNLDQIIEINKGSNDNIVPGLAVTVGAGLVGKVTTPVLPDRAYVMLLTDDRYQVGVKVVPGTPPETTTTVAPVGSDVPVALGSAPPVDGSVPEVSVPGTEPPSTSIPEVTLPTDTPPGDTTTTVAPTTTIDGSNRRDTGRLRGQGGGHLPQVDFLADAPALGGRFNEGDIVLTSGGTDGLAPPDIPIGVVTNVIYRSSADGPLLEVEQLADLSRLHFVRVVLYKPESETPGPIGTQAGG